MRILPFGDRALLAETDTEAVLALHAGLAASRVPGVVDLVPAARTVLVRVAPDVLPLSAATAWIERTAHVPAADAADRPVREVALPIVYDGPDLAAVAADLGLSVEALAGRHAATVWTVAFTGFAPGFGYLAGSDWPFDVPRLDVPRTRVPAGAVGLAAGFCGAYPRATPGGWRLIGTTDAVLFDPRAADPVLLTPGTRVRFTPRSSPTPGPTPHLHPDPAREQRADESAVGPRTLGGQVFSRPGAGGASGASGAGGAAAIEVLEPGLLATVQDLGRPGRASLGIAVSGALDRRALRVANRLVGNREDAAGVEVTAGGFRAVALRDVWAAVAGAQGALRIGGRPADVGEAFRWAAGQELEIGWFERGVRGYLAVRGGIDAPVEVGARATDTMAGLGRGPLRGGDTLAVADAVSGPVPPAATVTAYPSDGDLVVELAPGPRADWFADAALAALYDAAWTVTDRADRVGIRLSGPALTRTRPDELPSEGMVPGSLQVPPDGRPVILVADGPVTGGYPVIAVVVDTSLDDLAQARPGTRVRFRHARPPH